MRRLPLLALALVLALVAAGCGGSGGSQERAQTAPRTIPEAAPDAAPAPAPPGSGVPKGVPSAPAGDAPAGAEPVIRRWLAAVRDADFDRAAGTFARNAKVQNGGPVLRLRDRAAAVLWNSALPCGAKLTKIGGAGGYAVVQFELVDRKGSACGSGKGAPAYGAIRVQDGRITEWYRLPGPVAPSGDPNAPFV